MLEMSESQRKRELGKMSNEAIAAALSPDAMSEHGKHLALAALPARQRVAVEDQLEEDGSREAF